MRSLHTTTMVLVSLLVSLLTAQAATYTWDTVTGDELITDGSGTWEVGVGNWRRVVTGVSTNYDRAWTNGNMAVFGTTTSGGGDSVVTLGGDITTANADSSVNFGGSTNTFTLDLAGYTLKVGTVKVTGATPNTGAAVITNGVVEMRRTSTWSITDGPLKVYSQITGGFGIDKYGTGHIHLLNTNNAFTGTLSMNNGGDTYVSSIGNIEENSAAGAGSTIKISNNADLVYTGSGDSTDRTLKVGNTGSVIYSKGTGALIFAGPFVNSANANKALTLRGANTDLNEIGGNLVDNGANLLSLTKYDAGKWILSGTNTYTGNTAINGGTLVFAEGGETRFVIGGAGTNNMLTGSATVMLDGAFRFDLSGASTTVGDAWQIVGTSLNETFGETFSALSTTRAFSQIADTWVAVEDDATYSFSPADGTLTVIPALGVVVVVR